MWNCRFDVWASVSEGILSLSQMSPWSLTYVTEYELVLLKHVNFTKWKKTSAIDFKPGLHKQRKPLRPIIGFDRTRGWGYSTKFYTGRIWDVPSGVIFCGSCILMLLGICCIYFSNTFFIMLLSVPGFLLLPELSVAFIPHILSLYFDSFLVGWSYQKGGRFYPVCSYYNVWSVGFYLTICLSKSILASPTRLWYCFCYCLCLYSSLCRCFGVDTGTPNDDLPLNTLKTLLRLPRVLLDL